MVRRRRLAAELRRLREVARLTCDEVAAQLECSASKISRIETGRVLVSPRDVRDLLAIYGVPEEQRNRLIQMLMERQRQAAARTPKVWVVLDEAALRRQVGGREVMRQQIEHLLELSS